jgi:hypothetical protein
MLFHPSQSEWKKRNLFLEDFSWVSITLPFMRLSILYEAIIYHHQNPTMLLYSPLMLLLSHIMDIIANSKLRCEFTKYKVVWVFLQFSCEWRRDQKCSTIGSKIFFHCAYNSLYFFLVFFFSLNTFIKRLFFSNIKWVSTCWWCKKKFHISIVWCSVLYIQQGISYDEWLVVFLVSWMLAYISNLQFLWTEPSPLPNAHNSSLKRDLCVGKLSDLGSSFVIFFVIQFPCLQY